MQVLFIIYVMIIYNIYLDEIKVRFNFGISFLTEFWLWVLLNVCLNKKGNKKNDRLHLRRKKIMPDWWIINISPYISVVLSHKAKPLLFKICVSICRAVAEWVVAAVCLWVIQTTSTDECNLVPVYNQNLCSFCVIFYFCNYRNFFPLISTSVV